MYTGEYPTDFYAPAVTTIPTRHPYDSRPTQMSSCPLLSLVSPGRPMTASITAHFVFSTVDQGEYTDRRIVACTCLFWAICQMTVSNCTGRAPEHSYLIHLVCNCLQYSRIRRGIAIAYAYEHSKNISVPLSDRQNKSFVLTHTLEQAYHSKE